MSKKKKSYLLFFFDRFLRCVFLRPRKDTKEDRRKKKELEEAGIEVHNIETIYLHGDLDKKARKEVEKKLNVHLYKAKDRETLERFELPPLKEGIFVLHNGEFCAGTDVAYVQPRESLKRKES